MRNFTLLSILFAILFSGSISAQQEPCLFDRITNKEYAAAVENKIQEAAKAYEQNSRLKSHDTLRTIPVVVHVIHTGGAENISEAQINGQINVLNQDFQKQAGSPGNGNGVNSLLAFKLAKIDPNGNCTNGIIRIKSELAKHQSYQRGLLKELSFWDNKKYFNMYVVQSINGSVAGYASFPGGPDSEDGIVVQHNYFGKTGTASNSTGRTTTHEVGHWLGLYHTFQNGCDTDVCTGGDYVCDTPPQFEPNYACTDLNTCSNDSPDLNDQKENYMNYTPGTCQNMFTAGQAARIHGTLDSIRTNIWSYHNLVTTGVDADYQAPNSCPVIADFTVLNKGICIGNSISFIEKSQNGASSWNWTFQGGDPASSSEQNPTISYTNIGSYDVKLVVSDAQGNKDSLAFKDYVIVSEPGTGAALPFMEDMESGLFPPASLELLNNDGGITWELDSAASTSGKYSLRINNLINTNYGSADELVLPYLNLASSTSNPFMRFNYAYAKSDETYSDELLVLMSLDCGATFEQVMYKSQTSLTTAPTTTEYFIPDETQWKEAKILLFRQRSEENVLFKIVNVTDGGNNLYIDDIFVGDNNSDPTSIKDINSPIKDLVLFPNPSKNEAVLHFSLSFASKVDMSISDIEGRVLSSENLGFLRSGPQQQKLVNSGLKSGLYYVTIQSETASRTLKMYIH